MGQISSVYNYRVIDFDYFNSLIGVPQVLATHERRRSEQEGVTTPIHLQPQMAAVKRIRRKYV